MATCVLCRRVPRLPYLRGLKKEFTQAQHLTHHGKSADEPDEQEGKKGRFQHQDAYLQAGYQLYYNPSAYQNSAWNSATSWSQTENDEDERCVPTHATSVWQQSNRYSISCSRHLSSSKNTLLDLAFNKSPGQEKSSALSYQGNPISPDVKIDPRAFHKCRPEYEFMSVDLTQRPHPLEWEEVVPLLQKVSILKGNMKPADVSRIFSELSRLHPDKMPLVRDNQRFTMLLRYSVDNLRLFTNLQLLKVLQSFVLLDMPSTHTVLGLYEIELSQRAKQMTLRELLLAADLWRCIGRQVPQFLHHLYDSVQIHLEEMGVPELVQLLYLVGESRQFPANLIEPVEHILICSLHEMHSEEIGTVCLAYFKSQTPMSESVLTETIDMAYSFIKEMSDFTIVNVMKYLRFSYLYHGPWMDALAKEIPQRAPTMGVMGLMHVALACSALHYCNDNILTAIADRVPSLIQHCRSKDSSKLLWAFGTSRFQPALSPNLYPSLTEAMRQKKAEFQRYPQHLLTGLLGLAFVSEFPEDLISLALHPDFVKLALKLPQLELKKDLFTLDGTVAIELPHWTGPRISPDLREEIAEMLWNFSQSDVCLKPEVLEAESSLKELLGGEEFVCKRMILPHTRSIDLEVHLDSNGKSMPVNLKSHTATISPQSSLSTSNSKWGWRSGKRRVTISEELVAQLTNTKSITEPLTPSSTVKHGSFHTAEPEEGRLVDPGLHLTGDIETLSSSPNPAKGIVKLAIQISTRKQHCCNTHQLLGFHAMKRRQLKVMGYKVVELSYYEWIPMLRKSKSERLAYLHNKLYGSQK